MRRQRNLDKVEIPERDVMVTDELLGKGGFGAVYIADYNGRNVAAKVRICTYVEANIQWGIRELHADLGVRSLPTESKRKSRETRSRMRTNMGIKHVRRVSTMSEHPL